MIVNLLIVVGLLSGLVALFVFLSVALRLAELASPRFAAWVERLDSERRGF